MASGGKNSSTERLLDLMRREGGAGQTAGAPSGGSPKGGKRGRGAKGGKTKTPRVPRGPKVSKAPKGGAGSKVLGIDIGSDALYMVTMAHSARGRKLTGFKHVPYGAGVTPESPEFAIFLKREVRNFVGRGVAGYEVWTHISDAKTELWHIRVAKVPRSQLVDAVFWTVKKEKQFDENEFILDFEMQGDVVEKGLEKIAVMVYLVPRKQVETLTAIFANAGIKLTGVTISPIAIQTIFRTGWVSSGAPTTAHLYVGRNWSRIEIFVGNDLVLSRGIKAGSNSMIEALMDNYNMQSGKASSGGAPSGDSEPVISLGVDEEAAGATSGGGLSASVGGGSGATLNFDQAKQVLWSKLLDYPMSPSEPGGELSEIDTLKMIRPAAERLIRQVERTFEYHTTTMGNERVERIFFSGELASNQMLIKYIHSQLGIDCQILETLDPNRHNLGKAGSALTSLDRLSFNLATALALSENAITPNLKWTFKDRETARKMKSIKATIMVVGVLAVAALVGVAAWQFKLIADKKEDLAAKQVEYETKFNPPATKEELNMLAGEIMQKNEGLRRASTRFEALAVLSELSNITPDNIKIKNLSINLGEAPDAPAGEKKIIMEGLITGDERLFNHNLAKYFIELQTSELFGTPEILSSEVSREFSPDPVYHFQLTMDIM